MITTNQATVAFITFFSMVGDIDDDGFLTLKTAYHLIYHRVVVQHGVVILRQDLPLSSRQIGSQGFVIGPRPPSSVGRIALLVRHMLSHEVKNGEVVRGVLLSQTVVFAQQTLVKTIHSIVACIELSLTQHRMIEEETAAEVVDRFTGLG